jgi:aminoglycoside 2'-N-acetyltransferase I
VLVGGTPAAPFPSDQWDKVTLASFFSPRAREAAERFAGARIGLYPGAIDKLW